MIVCQVQITPMMLWLKAFYQIGLGQVFGTVIPLLLTHKGLSPILPPSRSGFSSKG